MDGGATFHRQHTGRPAVGIPGASYVEMPPSGVAAKTRLRAELRAALPVLGWTLVSEPRSGAPAPLLHVRTLRPAACDFTVALRFGRHDAALSALARSGVLGIAVEPIRVRGGTIVTPSVMLQVSGRELVRTLVRAWGRQGGRHATR